MLLESLRPKRLPPFLLTECRILAYLVELARVVRQEKPVQLFDALFLQFHGEMNETFNSHGRLLLFEAHILPCWHRSRHVL